MPYEIRAAVLKAQLVLTGKIGIADARELWLGLQPFVEAGKPVQVLAGDVEAMDTSIVQILCRLMHLQTGLEIVSASVAFDAGLRYRGIAAFTPPASLRAFVSSSGATAKATAVRVVKNKKVGRRRVPDV